MKEYTIFILPDGTINFLYDDVLKPLLECGESSFRRASNIDPKMTKDGPRWFVDLSLSSGPEIGPFETKDEAIKAEIDWLNARIR